MLPQPSEKKASRATSPACPLRVRPHPALALRTSGQEDELPERINYSCYLQMDQVSDSMIPALQEESSREICGSTHSAMLSEGAVTFSPWAVGGGRGRGRNKV